MAHIIYEILIQSDSNLLSQLVFKTTIHHINQKQQESKSIKLCTYYNYCKISIKMDFVNIIFI